MRQVKLLFILLLTVIIAVSCKSVSYVPRTIDIVREDAKQGALNAELKVDLTQKVSASSDLQESKKDALINAYHNCITNNNIDVVVDPIFKLTKYSIFSSKKMKNSENAKWWTPQFKAEITGFAGKYVKVETESEQVKKYDNIDMNSVIKYKMITDPEFHKSYYNNQKSNNLYINSNLNPTSENVNKAPQTGQLTPLLPSFNVQPISYSEMMKKGKTTRNVGIAFSVIGVALLAPVGATLYCVEDDLAGICCMGIGGGLTAIGIGCIGGGVAQINKAKRNISFTYNIAPNGAQLAINF